MLLKNQNKVYEKVVYKLFKSSRNSVAMFI